MEAALIRPSSISVLCVRHLCRADDSGYSDIDIWRHKTAKTEAGIGIDENQCKIPLNRKNMATLITHTNQLMQRNINLRAKRRINAKTEK